MSSRHLRLGRLAGIPISLDYSWFLIVFLLTWSLGATYFPNQFPGWASWQYWAIGATATLLLFVSVLLHELGHATAARLYGISVREITLFIFGGVAQIQEEPKSAWSEFWIAIAGPIVSLGLGLLFELLALLAEPISQFYAIFSYLGYVNLALFAFNLIPGFPLDGGRVLRAILWGASKDTHRATLIAANVGRFIAYGFIALGLVMILKGNFFDGMWLAFIGWFLESAAVAQVQQQKLRDILSRYHVFQAMNTHLALLPAHTTLDVIVHQHLLSSARRAYLVARDGIPVGMLTIHQIQTVPRQQWEHTTAEDVMIPLEQARIVAPSDDLWTALSAMDREGVNQLLVMDRGQVVGMLSREDVVSFLQTLNALGV
jgi:Zn-dependent protease